MRASTAYHDHLREELGDINAECHVCDHAFDDLPLLVGVSLQCGIAQTGLELIDLPLFVFDNHATRICCHGRLRRPPEAENDRLRVRLLP